MRGPLFTPQRKEHCPSPNPKEAQGQLGRRRSSARHAFLRSFRRPNPPSSASKPRTTASCCEFDSAAQHGATPRNSTRISLFAGRLFRTSTNSMRHTIGWLAACCFSKLTPRRAASIPKIFLLFATYSIFRTSSCAARQSKKLLRTARPSSPESSK